MKLTTFGCGAGTQSTALAFLIRDGRVERPDHVLFADTGNEPAAVYANVAFLKALFEDLGIPFHIVGRFGEATDIAADVLDRQVYATIPANTVVDKVVRTPIAWRGCGCDWHKVFRVGGEDGAKALGYFAPGVTYGQITDHVAYHGDGVFDECDICCADAELVDFDYTARALLMLDELGWVAVPPPHKKCRSAGRIATEFHTYTKSEMGRIKRECTGKYKIEPIERKIRVLLGAREWDQPCQFCGATGVRVAPWDVEAGEGACSVCVGSGVRHRVGSAPKGSTVRHMIGFSADEFVERATTAGFPATTTPIHPLTDLGLTRADCESIIRANGRTPVRSACKICPNHGNAEWRDMRDNRPDEWAEVCAYDDAIREVPGLRGRRLPAHHAGAVA